MEIVIQSRGAKLRAALFEDGQLAEVLEDCRLAGSIYRGRVENVLPGMQAAFVDVGLAKNAFLYVADAVPAGIAEASERMDVPLPRVDAILRARQEVLVQIVKEPVGSKGARVTTNLTLPGRYAVLLPTVNHVGVSRKIDDKTERERLRAIAAAARPSGMGVIVRTLAAGVSEAEIVADIAALVELWQEITAKMTTVPVPGLVHQDVGLVIRLVRDFLDDEVERITVDDGEVAGALRKALLKLGHPAANRIVLSLGEDLFALYAVDAEIKKALMDRVWLKSGGYLVIQETEALTAVDVNTGKYVGDKSLPATVLRTNLEAAREIGRQVRLRNLGGIIVVDFIDMDAAADGQEVLAELERALARDKTRSQVLGLTRLGLVEMTRKKVGQTLSARYAKLCPACAGRGRVY